MGGYPAAFVGRQRELAALGRLLDAARGGRSGALVLHGPPGVGKTALLERCTERAGGFRTIWVTGAQSERDLAFAALHQFCSPILDQLDQLPDPQRLALEVTFGMCEGAAPDRFFAGLAVLGLVSKASEPGPLLFVVDDAHWLDRSSAQILAFVARRLAAEPVGVLFATRDPGGDKRERSQRSPAVHSERRRWSRPGAVPSQRRANPPPE